MMTQTENLRPRRAKAKTSKRTIEKIRYLVTAIGGDFSRYESKIPDLDVDAQKMAKQISKRYQEMKAAGLVVATASQLHYAARLARRHKVALPENRSMIAIDEFITLYRKPWVDGLGGDDGNYFIEYEDFEITPPPTVMPF